MRIVAGTAGGRRLVVPSGRDTRPTSERVREALFAALLSARGPLTGAAVLDLFAGSGALGLEALSRGAASAVLVERDRTAAASARANVGALRLPGARVVSGPVTRYLARRPEPADLVFADPPYALPEPELAAVLSTLADGWLQPGADVVVERSARSPAPGWPAGFRPGRVRTYGDTAVHNARWEQPAAPGSAATEAGTAPAATETEQESSR